MSKIHKLDSAELQDIPAVLRSIADHLEKGTYGKVMAGVVILECDNNVLEIFGMGAALDKHRAVSLCACSQQVLVQRKIGVAVNTN